MHAGIDDPLPDLTRRLRGLPDEPGPVDGWQAVQGRIHARTRQAWLARRVSRFAVAASVAALALIVTVRQADEADATRPVTAAAATNAVSGSDSVESLRARSKALDAALAALPARPAVSRASTALPIETFEAQVQWLDHQLSLQATGARSSRDAERLWRERVELMSSLVQLRYVEAQTLVM